MTYARFLLLFVAVPVLFQLWRNHRAGVRLRWRPLLALLAVVYATTTPWDRWAVRHGLWDFDPARIWGVRVAALPIEELLFFGLQTLLTGLWVQRRLAHRHA